MEGVATLTTATLLLGAIVVVVLLAVGLAVMKFRVGGSSAPPGDRLRIQALDVDAEIEVLHVEGNMPNPSDIAKVAVYDFSTLPTDISRGIAYGVRNTVLAAYQGSGSQPGPFHGLDSLTPGQAIQLSLGSRSSTYFIVAICEVNAESSRPAFYGTPVESLTLMTEHPTDGSKRIYARAELERGSLAATCPIGTRLAP
jgi:hypothetical protein